MPHLLAKPNQITQNRIAPLRNRSIEARTIVALALPAIFILAMVSSQTGFNRHIRYVLPAYPFIIIASAAALNRANSSSSAMRKRVCQVLLLGFVASSLSVYPHSMSYFNWIFGGPGNGHYFFVNSNIDRGQDLFLVEYWKRAHPEIHIDGYGLFYPTEQIFPGRSPAPYKPTPGWYIISVDRLHSYDSDRNYSYFLNYKPFAWIGWSVHVYHIEK